MWGMGMGMGGNPYGYVRCGYVRCGYVRCGYVRCGYVRCGYVYNYRIISWTRCFGLPSVMDLDISYSLSLCRSLEHQIFNNFQAALC